MPRNWDEYPGAATQNRTADFVAVLRPDRLVTSGTLLVAANGLNRGTLNREDVRMVVEITIPFRVANCLPRLASLSMYG